ncbi:hypothetical protein ES703_35193 [subsurface metagenome]
MVHSSLFVDNRLQTSDIRHQTSDNRHQEVTQIAIVSQNAGKQGFFVISGRNTRHERRETSDERRATINMQNKANFQKSQVNVNLYNTRDYENKSNWTLGENKPNSNPIKANFRKAKMNVNSLITKDYRKNDVFAVQKNKPNSNPIPRMSKMNVNSLITKDYRKIDTFAVQKSKPKQSQFQTGHHVMDWMKDKMLTGRPGAGRIPHDSEVICRGLSNEKGFQICL